MISSEPTEFPYTQSSNPSGGSYFLARHVLRVTVTKKGRQYQLTVAKRSVADRTQLLNTGLSLSAFAEDVIKVEMTKEGVLTQITSSADDKTAEIIEGITKLVYSPLFRKDLIVADAAEPIWTADFDPFNAHEAIETNAVLRKRFNSCVEVEIEPGVWSPGCGSNAIVKAKAVEQQLIVIQNLAAQAPGIYYRRPISHRVNVVENGVSRSVTNETFSNVAPLFRIDIDRAIFVKVQHTIIFQDGSLTQFNITKPSEGQAFVVLLPKLVGVVLAAPIDEITQRKKIIDAETMLTQSLAAKAQQDAAAAAAVTGNAAPVVVPVPEEVRSAVYTRAAPVNGYSNGLTSAELARCAQIGLNAAGCHAAVRGPN